MTNQTRTEFRGVKGFLNLLTSRALPMTSPAADALTTQPGLNHLNVVPGDRFLKPFVTPAILFAIATVFYPAAAHAAADIVSTTCIVSNVYVVTANLPFDQPRITVACSSVFPSSNITSFAFPLFVVSDQDYSSTAPLFQLLTNFLSAQVNVGRAVTISYDENDTSANNWGCGSSNCRIILSINPL